MELVATDAVACDTHEGPHITAGPQIQGERYTLDTAEEGLYGGCLVSSLGRQWGRSEVLPAGHRVAGVDVLYEGTEGRPFHNRGVRDSAINWTRRSVVACCLYQEVSSGLLSVISGFPLLRSAGHK